MAEANRSDPTSESRLQFRRAAWCGLVSALALVITVLNVFPPIPIEYRVRSKVVLSGPRLALLQARARRDRGETDVDQRVKVVTVNVLDRSTVANEWLALNAGESTKEDLILAEVISVWQSTCTALSHQTWLDLITKSGASSGSSELARDRRFARWQLEAVQHYVEREEFLSTYNEPASAGDGRTFELVNQPKQVSAKLASHTVAVDGQTEGTTGVDNRHSLLEQLAFAQQAASQSEKAWQDGFALANGLLQVADQPKIDARTRSIPTAMVMSVLILAVCSGSMAGWYQRRLQSGGAHDPAGISERLQRHGLPVAARCQLASDQAAGSRWLDAVTRNAIEASRRIGRNLLRISESTLSFWVVIIGIRILIDPMWRAVLCASPLAALGRALAGMP